MEWHDDAIVLAARKHGESSAIVSLLTRDHGRYAGLVRGGSDRRKRGLFQPGNRVRATWRARLAEHLGSFTCEMTDAVAAAQMDDPLRLAALSSVCAVAETALPERESHRPVYEGLGVFLDCLDGDIWPTIYVKWEIGLLRELGFGLDLSCCAATGLTENLTHVSPKTARAVSAEAAEPYKSALLDLPPFLLNGNAAEGWAEIRTALRLTGFFLERHVFRHRRTGAAPASRGRLVDLIQKAAKGA